MAQSEWKLGLDWIESERVEVHCGCAGRGGGEGLPAAATWRAGKVSGGTCRHDTYDVIPTGVAEVARWTGGTWRQSEGEVA